MMTISQVAQRSGVSVRTLQYYDSVGLLPPAARTQAGYRLYDDASLERLSQILLFRALEFPLEDIQEILARPDFDRDAALETQIQLLEMKRDRLDSLILFARGLKTNGGNAMDFSAFDTSKMDAYAEEAKAKWGKTDAWKQYEGKRAGRSKEAENALGKGMMLLFEQFGKIKDAAPESEAAQALCAKLQAYITEHFYGCTKEILASLGAMYEGEAFAANIDAAGGEGTARFAAAAIEIYCQK